MPFKTVFNDGMLWKPTGHMITPWSPEASTAPLLESGLGTISGSVGWFSASKPVAIPFTVATAAIATHLGVALGTTGGNTFDIGIYDTSFNKIVSLGSTTMTVTAAWQWTDITDTVLNPGRYYLAASCSNTATQRIMLSSQLGTSVFAMAGVMDSGTNSLPLANPLASMVSAATFSRVPLIAIATRPPYV